MTRVHAIFDCGHGEDVDVRIEDDVEIPPEVRGLGKCPACRNESGLIPVAGIAPKPDGRTVVLDSIMMMPV